MGFGVAVGVSVGRDVSVGKAVSVGITGTSVGGIASGVGEEQETRRRKRKEESRLVLTTERRCEGARNAACLCMGGF